LLYKDNAPVDIISGKSKLGAKNLSIFKRKKEIPQEIRDLWGEFKEPEASYAISVSKMSNLIANHQFLKEAKDAGMGNFFFDKPIVNKNGEFVAKIAADQSSALSPLNGLYTTKEIVKAFQEATTGENLNTFWRGYMKLVTTAKIAKTIGSYMTHVRNVTGNLAFAVARGDWDVRNLPKAFKNVFSDTFNKSNAEVQKEIRELIELRVLGDAARAGELRGMIDDAVQGNIEAITGNNLVGKIKKGVSFATKIYGAEDDLWKYYGFKTEFANYKKIFPEKSDAEIKRIAARIIRDTYPTYSMVPKAIQKLRRFPFLGTFVSFPAEVIRTSNNLISLVREEMRDPRTRPLASKRIAGMILAATATTGVAIASRFMNGVDNDLDEAYREFLPPWAENQDIVYVSMGDGRRPTYINMGYSDPYSYLKSPIRAFLRGASKEEIIAASLDPVVEFLQPFLSEDVFSTKVFDVKRNKTPDGRAVYNPEDTPINIATDVLLHFGDALEPGTLSGIRRMFKAYKNLEGQRGTIYDIGTEAVAQITGVRLSKADVPRGLRFHSFEFARRKRLINRLAKIRGEEAKGENFTNLMNWMGRKVNAARIIGLTSIEIKVILKDGGVSAKDRIDISNVR